MENIILKFMINKKPFFATDSNFYNRNLEYLKNLNPNYFKDVVNRYDEKNVT